KSDGPRAQQEQIRGLDRNIMALVQSQAPQPRWTKALSRKAYGFLFCWYLSVLTLSAQPAEPSLQGPKASSTNKVARSFSVSSPDRLADWQKHLTLGPGDILEMSLYGQADSLRSNLSIGPDGRLNYLEARD